METEIEKILKKYSMKYHQLKATDDDIIIKASDFEAITNEIEKLFITPPIKEYISNQICPKCNGDGDLFRYHSPALMGTNAKPICDVCNGKKIIPMAHC